MKDIMAELHSHKEEAERLENGKYRPIYIALQGSQNYKLETENSDIDTKVITLPSLDQIIKNGKPTSFTHVRENNEHIDMKDVRLMFDCFKKQNINFIEILFSDYYIIMNENYRELIEELRSHAEEIAVLNPYRAIKCMKGMAFEKYHALCHPYPAKIDIINKYGYDGKQLHHLLRLEYFLDMYRYMITPPDAEVKYKDILRSGFISYSKRDDLKLIKENKFYSLDEAKEVAEKTLSSVVTMADNACASLKDENNKETEKLLDDILYKIVKQSLADELNN
ncbi:MAG: nucleotidyltransferase domain-containing protein [Candidatus Onthovivens sp.]|nr:nucleotidyltransferase domain-containing protein [Candidatus Onthovivens sp.]